MKSWTSLAIQWFRIHACTAGGTGSIPGRGTKIWHATQWGQKFKKKKKEILPFVTTWMELESVTLSEISQTEEDKYHVISLKCGI